MCAANGQKLLAANALIYFCDNAQGAEGQLEQIKTFAYQLPRHLCSQYLHHLAQLLPRDFGDADVWRAAHKAVHEVMHPATRGEERARFRVS